MKQLIRLNQEINKKLKKQKNNMEELVRKMAEIIIGDNRNYVGVDVASEAIKELEKAKEEGEESNEESQKNN